MRKSEYPISEQLAVVLGSQDCELKGWVGIARPVNLDISDDVAEQLLKRSGVTAVTVFNLGPRCEYLAKSNHGTIAIGHAQGRLDTLVVLNALGSCKPELRRAVKTALSVLLKPGARVYFVRPLDRGLYKTRSVVKYFDDQEFSEELRGFFNNPTIVPSEHARYGLTKCGGEDNVNAVGKTEGVPG